jgi:protein tyrosine phosphatase (PTP) superfamily phosphohydrolase (DUF442 family)
MKLIVPAIAFAFVAVLLCLHPRVRLPGWQVSQRAGGVSLERPSRGKIGLESSAVVRREGPAKKINGLSIENVHRLSARLYSGGSPKNAADFAQLAGLGIRTVISVDGARPAVESAREQGLRYVHLPMGYDGISVEQAEKLARAVGQLPGPVFVHCHHGRHRGPAAAAICAVARDGWSRDQALDWLRQAGTSRDYSGLIASVQSVALPDCLSELPDVGDLLEVAEVSTFVNQMVQIERLRERLKRATSAAGGSADDPDELAHDAVLLTEHLRETARLPESPARGGGFLEALLESEKAAERLHALLASQARLRAGIEKTAVERLMSRLEASCAACHERFRDVASD